ncbi:hypothetical protein E2C01_018192 [Portunus trituberculatus]|uniref:Secreted protein n=1 Tax=Portunus trituberculatus TaxID=210409 RepID=A0A5B7DTW0_PORTR|nr:hypothetical protein [Portunus trituberculatus]
MNGTVSSSHSWLSCGLVVLLWWWPRRAVAPSTALPPCAGLTLELLLWRSMTMWWTTLHRRVHWTHTTITTFTSLS